MKDRGIKKWNAAAFLPEHGKMLQDIYYEDLKVPMPVLDEHEIQEINSKLTVAFEKRLPVNLKLHYDGFKEWEGPVIIKKIDAINQQLKIEFLDKMVKIIKLENLIGVQFE